MKITISFLPGETREADLIYRFVRGLCPEVRTHSSEKHPPFRHIYLTTPRVDNIVKRDCKQGEDTI